MATTEHDENAGAEPVPPAPAADAPTSTDSPMSDDLRAKRAGALRIVHRYVAASAIAGLNPVPVLDVTILGGVHISLIKDLTEHYGAAFSQHAARNILIAVAATIIPGAVGTVIGRRALRAIPFLVPGAGLLTMSAFSAAVSYGLGRVFINHFETGGTLDSFNLENLHRVFNWNAS